MEKEDLDFTLFVFDPASPGPCEQYIMPHITGEMQQEPESFAAVGAAWNNRAIGAAVITEDPDEPGAAAVASLFVDPEVRGKGVGKALLAACADIAAEAGAKVLTLTYTLDGEDLEAMDCVVRSMGGVPEFRRPVFTMSSADLHEGRVAAFLLGRMSSPGSYAVQGIWRSDSAPFNTIHTLLLAHVNLCYTHNGGADFLYHCSAAVDFVYRLIQTYTEGKRRRFEEHHAVLAANAEKSE